MEKNKIISNLLSKLSLEKKDKLSILIEIANFYFQNNDYKKALDFFLLAIDLPNCINKISIYLEIGKIYRILGDNKNSLKYLSLIENLEIDENTKCAIYLEIANVYISEKKLKDSIKYLEYIGYNGVGEICVNSSILLAKIYRDNHEYLKALKILEKIKNPPSCYLEEIKILNNMIEREMYDRFPGNYGFNGNYYDLITTYKDVLQQNPNNEQVLCFLSQVYNYLGLYDKTIKLYDENNKVIKNKFFNNKFLNEYEIASKKTILNSKPRNLMVVLSNKCNIKCIMCMTSRSKWELPKNRLDEIINLFPYLERIMWQGGEVLLLPYFKDILRKTLNYKNLRQSMISNFQLADEEIIRLIVDNNIELTISIDGICKEIYENIRVGGKFEKLVSNLQLLLDYRNKYDNKMILNMNVVVMRENYHKLSTFIEFAHKYKFDFVCFMQLDYVPKNEIVHDMIIKEQQDIFTYKDEIEMKILSYQMMLVKEKAKEYGIRVESRLPTNDMSNIEMEEYKNKEKWYEQYVINKKSSINEIINKKYGLYALKQNNLEYNIDNGETLNSQKCIDYINNIKIIDNNSKNMICHLPWYSLTFDFDGSVRPDCQCFITKNIGYLKDSSVEDLWNDVQMQYYRKKILNNDYQDLCSNNCIKNKIVDFHLKLL